MPWGRVSWQRRGPSVRLDCLRLPGLQKAMVDKGRSECLPWNPLTPADLGRAARRTHIAQARSFYDCLMRSRPLRVFRVVVIVTASVREPRLPANPRGFGDQTCRLLARPFTCRKGRGGSAGISPYGRPATRNHPCRVARYLGLGNARSACRTPEPLGQLPNGKAARGASPRMRAAAQ